jgi:hypothetical protein
VTAGSGGVSSEPTAGWRQRARHSHGVALYAGTGKRKASNAPGSTTLAVSKPLSGHVEHYERAIVHTGCPGAGEPEQTTLTARPVVRCVKQVLDRLDGEPDAVSHYIVIEVSEDHDVVVRQRGDRAVHVGRLRHRAPKKLRRRGTVKMRPERVTVGRAELSREDVGELVCKPRRVVFVTRRQSVAAELPAAEWLGVREGVLREMRGRLGLELLARAAVEAAVDSGWAEPEGEAAELVKDVCDELSGSIVGGGAWSTSISHRRDVDDISDACYDLIYLALATFRGEPAPERLRKVRTCVNLDKSPPVEGPPHAWRS